MPDTSDRYTVTDAGYKTPCWLWCRTVSKKGYARLSVPSGHRGGRNVEAHRHLWIEVNGPVPEGLVLDHLCRNKTCVNPEHLEPVTHLENVRRGVRPKLNIEKVRAIRASSDTTQELAWRYRVSDATILRIKGNHTWADLDAP